ncbi:MAG: ABC transporter ATP-binding protein [Clostridiaceae bacterium]|jgi:putative ABC transport system ATP-binding protein|nr:ABC transporter ATP-binding protein [Oscillospiraceae bacterium]NLO61831.1 ABC transporter ATP-binding protein [Clostridiaceae bacterium]
MAFIEFEGVGKRYRMGEYFIPALSKVCFAIEKGETAIISGPSGAGKTTVLNILGGMDTCDEGRVVLDGTVISNLSPKALTRFRREEVGFVFQFYNLIPNLTALENVELATEICRNPMDPRSVMDQVGLSDRLGNFPSQLSGGEQQRVAIARAIARNPKILLCDEPTGALDDDTGKSILRLLRDMSDRLGMTVVIISHNTAYTPIADRVIHLKNGSVARIDRNASPVDVDQIVG